MTQEQKQIASNLKRLGHSYKEIASKLKVEYNAVYFYLHGKNPPQKKPDILEKILETKIRCFSRIPLGKNRWGKNKSQTIKLFNFKELLEKIGPNPTCYLTGEPIDLLKPETYHLDHILPRSQGGDNSLSNCGLATNIANQAKAALTKDQFVELCKKVISHNNSI